MGIGSVVGRATFRAVRITAVTAVLLALIYVGVTRLPGWLSAPPDRKDEPAAVSAGVAGPIVTLDRERQEKGGIASAPLDRTTYQEQLTAFATVLTLDRFATLYNNALTQAAQLDAAKAKFASARVADQHAQKMLKVFTTAVAQAETASAALKVEAANVEAAQTQLDTLRNTAIQDWGPSLGAAIADRSQLAERLVLRKDALIQLSLPPGRFERPPQKLAMRSASGATVEADYVSEAVQVDPKAQNIGYFYTAPMGPAVLPGLSLVATLAAGSPRPGVRLPATAIVWQAGSAWIYLRRDDDTFVRHALDKAAVPTEDGGFLVPAASLPMNEDLVVSGAQTLLSEESRSQFTSSGDDD